MFKRGKVRFVECAVATGCVDHHMSVVRQGAAKANAQGRKQQASVLLQGADAGLSAGGAEG